MEQKLRMFLTLCMAVLFSATAWAQERTITGRVTEGSGEGAIGVNVIVKGTTIGTATDFDGNYSLTVGEEAKILTYSGISYIAQDVEIGNQSKIDVTIASDVQQLNDVVVTALGISREKKSLGDAVQSIGGADVNTVKQANVVNSLSGKISGVQIQAADNLGGSTNVIIRGQSSINNNQALFVVDGVPLNNSSFNSGEQNRGGGGYDYGSPISDINPDDIESISVLKGASAAALYGTRGANGVILITTKKGSKGSGVGVSVSSGVSFQTINKSTLPKYQDQYGAGYGSYYGPNEDAYFNEADLDGDGVNELLVPYSEDAGWGAKFDPSLQVVHWDALDPNKTGAEWGDKQYGATRPWEASKNGPEAYFETGRTISNSVSLNGGTDVGSYRFSYTNNNSTGVQPNSEQKSNTFTLNASWNLSEKLTSSASATYVNTYTKNRPGQGYDNDKSRAFMASASFWMQPNVDYKRLKDYQALDGSQLTWNRSSHDDAKPNYWDNPYWTANKNYTEDWRERLFGNWSVDYKVLDWLTATGRIGVDTYTFRAEERLVEGGLYAYPYYTKDVRTQREYNLDFFLKASKRFGEDITLDAFVGSNYRVNDYNRIGAGTVDGRKIPGVDWIGNSKNAELSVTDSYSAEKALGVFGSASLGYKDLIYLDLKARRDESSTLPGQSFMYGGASASFILTELPVLQNSKVLSFAKLRASYGEVGSATAPHRLIDSYSLGDFDGNITLGNNGWKGTEELTPERTKSWEIGAEASFYNNRIRADFTYYNKSTIDQIIAQDVPGSTGWYKVYTNAGEVQNNGMELTLGLTPVKNWNGLTWDIDLNWSTYDNEVIDIDGNPDTNDAVHLFNNYFVQVVAKEGLPMGALLGTNYVYNENGDKLVNEDGSYQVTDNFEVLGNANPDWIGGLRNTLSYKGITVSALIDMSVGGERFSLTEYWGKASGILEETVGTNDLGNPIRNPLTNDATSGGLILEGVKADGTPNDVRVDASAYGSAAFDNNKLPYASAIVDATYIKLREVSIGYTLPSKLMAKTPFTNVTLSVVGSNLAILKGPKHFDAEQTYGAGNVQGLEIGTLPSTRRYGFNLKFNF